MNTLCHFFALLALSITTLGLSETATNSIEVIRADWRDSKRDRVVPVKIYLPKSIQGPFPVIIFSHGLGGSREGYEYLGSYWARHGYVSVHLQHAGSDDAVWRDTSPAGRLNAMRRATMQPRNASDRARDVSFAMDHLEELNRRDHVLQGRLDLDRIGVAGHSFGAHTTLAVAGQNYTPRLGARTSLADPRVKAIIPMSAPVPRNQANLDAVYENITIPCLHMTGTEDTSPINDTKAAERRLPFDHCRNSDQFLVIFKDGDHMVFSGRPRTMGGDKNDARFHELICICTSAFWDAYLRGDAKAKNQLVQDFKRTLGGDGTLEVRMQRL